MSFGNRFWFGVLALWIGIALGGCLPSGQNQSDEEKEPHYVLGKSRVNAMDYQGAIQAFEESLETNPHSAAAHFELAMLYENKESDPAAAIYHYQQYLKFNPNAGNAEIIKQRIDQLQTTTGRRCAAVAEHARRAKTNQPVDRAKPAVAGRGQQMARLLREPTGG